MSNSISIQQTQRIVITDILILAVVYFIPAMAHMSNYKIYYLDPMRFFMLTGFLLSRNNINACILALTIPLFSSVVSGHPPFFKALLICIELLINIGSFLLFIKKWKWHTGVLLFICTIASKCVYYGCKYIFIETGLIRQELVATDLLTQLITVTALSILFSVFYRRNR